MTWSPLDNPRQFGLSRDGLAHVITVMPEPPAPEPDLVWIEPEVWDRLETRLVEGHMNAARHKTWGTRW